MLIGTLGDSFFCCFLSIYSVRGHSCKGQSRDCELGGHSKGRILRGRERTIFNDVTNRSLFSSRLVSLFPGEIRVIGDLVIFVINSIGFLDGSSHLALLTESDGVVSIFGSRPLRVEGLLLFNSNARTTIFRVESHALVGVTPNLAHHAHHALTSQLIEIWVEASITAELRS